MNTKTIFIYQANSMRFKTTRCDEYKFENKAPCSVQSMTKKQIKGSIITTLNWNEIHLYKFQLLNEQMLNKAIQVPHTHIISHTKVITSKKVCYRDMVMFTCGQTTRL